MLIYCYPSYFCHFFVITLCDYLLAYFSFHLIFQFFFSIFFFNFLFNFLFNLFLKMFLNILFNFFFQKLFYIFSIELYGIHQLILIISWELFEKNNFQNIHYLGSMTPLLRVPKLSCEIFSQEPFIRFSHKLAGGLVLGCCMI